MRSAAGRCVVGVTDGCGLGADADRAGVAAARMLDVSTFGSLMTGPVAFCAPCTGGTLARLGEGGLES